MPAVAVDRLVYCERECNTVATTVCVTLQAICAALISVAPVFFKWLLVAAVIVLAIANGILAWIQQQAIRKTTLKYRTIINDSAGPLVGVLIALYCKPKSQRRHSLGNLIKSVEGIATQHIGSGRTRVSVFEIGDGNGKHPYLKPMEAADMGRNDRSHSIFCSDSGEGAAVWRSLLEAGMSCCSDTSDEGKLPDAWDGQRSRAYRSYVSTRIDADHKMYGMLTINSTEKDAFSQDDISELQNLAFVIGLGMRMCELSATKYVDLRSAHEVMS